VPISFEHDTMTILYVVHFNKNSINTVLYNIVIYNLNNNNY